MPLFGKARQTMAKAQNTMDEAQETMAEAREASDAVEAAAVAGMPLIRKLDKLADIALERGGFAMLFPHGMAVSLTFDEWKSKIGVLVEAAEPNPKESNP